MELILGVDIGTTYTAAAAVRNGNVETIALGANGSTVMPSTLFVRDDGVILVGDAANARRSSEPDRYASAVKRRLLDGVPLVLGGRSYPPEVLLGEILGAVVRVAEERMQAKVDRLVLTHPASYQGYGQALVRKVAATQALPVTLLTEPVAAAWEYVARHPLPAGALLAIYDLGGGTFDTAIVRRTTDGFEVVGEALGIERLGGLDFDAELLALVDGRIGHPLDGLDGSDPETSRALLRLQQHVRSAKEHLAHDSDAIVDVGISGLPTSVTVTQRELDSAITARVKETIDLVDRAVRSSGHTFEDLSAIVLAGGSTRLPIVRRLIEERTQRQVVAGIDPDVAIARGAALSAMPKPAAPPDPPAPPQPARFPSAPPEPPRRGVSRRVLLGSIAGVVVAGGAAVFVATHGSDDATDSTTASTGPDSSSATDPTTAESSPSTPDSGTTPDTTSEPTTPITPVPELAGFTSIRGDVTGAMFVQVGDAGDFVDLGGDVIDAEISPDGSQVAAILRVGGSPRLFVGGFRGGDVPVQVFDGDATDPTWKPDGTVVAFAGASGSSIDVMAYSLFAGTVSTIVAAAGTDGAPAFSPDGTQLSFSSDREGGLEQIFIIELSTGATRRAAGSTLQAGRSTWLGDSSALVAEARFAGAAELAVIPLDGSAVRRLTATDAEERAPQRISNFEAVLATVSDPLGSFIGIVSLTDGAVVAVSQPGTRDTAARLLTETQIAGLSA